MIKKLTNDVYWINPCEQFGGDHLHDSSYLITADRNILIDSSAHLFEEDVRLAVENVVGNNGIDDLVITHADNPHAANAIKFARDWDAEIHSSVSAPGAQGLIPAGQGLRKIVLEHDFKIGNRRLFPSHFELVDRPNSNALFDYESSIFFTPDGCGHYHKDGECDLDWDAIQPAIADIKRYHKKKLPWIRFTIPAEFFAAIKDRIAHFNPSYIAPIHGTPIPREHIDSYMKMMRRALKEITDEYDGPSSPNPALISDES
jgi:flavorubredoxin